MNPCNLKRYMGKSLRKVSQSVLKIYQNIVTNSRIDDQCRRKCDSEILIKPINDSSLNIESDLEVDSDSDSSFKNLCSSREHQLDELLNGLKRNLHLYQKMIHCE